MSIAQELIELATNARLDHWPPHLGVTTDAEKVEYLAERLEEVADAEQRADELGDELETANEEIAMLKGEQVDLEQQVKTLKDDVARLEAKLESIREIVS